MPTQATLPDARGHFGQFGGQFIPETLMPAIEQLAEEYEAARNDPEFHKKLDYYRPATDDFADTPRVTLDEFRRCYGLLVDKILATGAALVLLTPLPINRSGRREPWLPRRSPNAASLHGRTQQSSRLWANSA